MKILLFLILWVLAPAHCGAAVSLVDVSSPFGGTKISLPAYGQTFTPTVSGTLDSLRLLLASPVQGAQVSVSVWSYDIEMGELGSLLGSGSHVVPATILNYQWIEVFFTEKIHQIAGMPLAFTVINPEGMGPAISNTSMYAGGAFFVYSGVDVVTLTQRDLTFQTMVTAVPEPQAPLLLGVVATMAAFRRKRAEVD